MLKYVPLSKDHLELVYRWRKSERVNRMMFTDFSGVTFDDHVNWYVRNLDQTGRFEWVIYDQETPIGVINFELVRGREGVARWGFYLGVVEKSVLAAFVVPEFLNYIFNAHSQVEITCLTGEVILENERVIKLQKHFGFVEVGVVKHGVTKPHVVLELKKTDWLAKTRYHKYRGAFLVNS